MLNIDKLHATVNEQEILRGINLQVKPGEVHAIMGPNGSGKSTLANVLAGHPNYSVTTGEIKLCEQDLLSMSVDERAIAGLFLAFQYPVEIPGVNNLYFLKAAYNNICKQKGLPELDAMDFITMVKEKMQQVSMDEKFLKRMVNAGFSGGEKKRNEILQLLVLDPKVAVLDETDSGLDIDALQTVAAGVNHFKNENNAVVLVTHYQRLLNYIKPDFVHVLMNGVIVKSGDATLALELEQKGYGWLTA